MYKTLMIVAMLIPILLVACNDDIVPSTWTSRPIEVDGASGDWADIPRIYDNDSGVSLGIVNDAQNIYLLLKFRNPQYTAMISRSGVTIWLDKAAKRRQDFGIKYRGGHDLVMAMNPPDSSQNQWGPPPRQQSGMMAATHLEEILVIDNIREVTASIRTDGSSGPAVAAGLEDGVFCYEFAIPLQKRTPGCYALEAAPLAVLSVGFEIGGMDKQMKPGGDDMGGGLPGTGMGGPPGGGMGGGPPPGGGMGGGPPGGGMGGGPGGKPGGGQQSMETQYVWLKTALAQDPATINQE